MWLVRSNESRILHSFLVQLSDISVALIEQDESNPCASLARIVRKLERMESRWRRQPFMSFSERTNIGIDGVIAASADGGVAFRGSVLGESQVGIMGM